MRKVEPTCIAACRAYIAALPERRPLSAYDVVVSIVPEINAALARGQDYTAIAKTLKPEGIALSGATLKKYVQRARKHLAASGEAPREEPARSLTLPAKEPHNPAHSPTTPAVHPQSAAQIQQGNGQDRTAENDGLGLDPGHFALIPDTENI